MKYLILPIFILLMYSCSNDACKDVLCANDGVCEEGICDCIIGYTGTLCEVEFRTQYLGSWDLDWECDGDEETGVLFIEVDPSNVLGLFLNLEGIQFSAILDLNAQVTIPDQTVVADGETSQLSGSGQLMDNSGEIRLNVMADGESFECNFILTR